MSEDRVRVSVQVRASPATAFALFTEEIDQWWGRGPAFRVGGRAPGVLMMEPRLGGRIFEQGAAGAPLWEVGEITAWEPPARLVFIWRSVTFEPGESTEVEVCFEPYGDGTRVTVDHHGWERIREDHPVRHGEPPAVFLRRLGRWWGSLAMSLRALAGSRDTLSG